MRIGIVQMRQAVKRAKEKVTEERETHEREMFRKEVREFLELFNDLVDLVNSNFGEKKRGRKKKND